MSLTKEELVLTQKMQLHFPEDEELKIREWNHCPAGVVKLMQFTLFSSPPSDFIRQIGLLSNIKEFKLDTEVTTTKELISPDETWSEAFGEVSSEHYWGPNSVYSAEVGNDKTRILGPPVVSDDVIVAGFGDIPYQKIFLDIRSVHYFVNRFPDELYQGDKGNHFFVSFKRQISVVSLFNRDRSGIWKATVRPFCKSGGKSWQDECIRLRYSKVFWGSEFDSF